MLQSLLILFSLLIFAAEPEHATETHNETSANETPPVEDPVSKLSQETKSLLDKKEVPNEELVEQYQKLTYSIEDELSEKEKREELIALRDKVAERISRIPTGNVGQGDRQRPNPTLSSLAQSSSSPVSTPNSLALSLGNGIPQSSPSISSKTGPARADNPNIPAGTSQNKSKLTLPNFPEGNYKVPPSVADIPAPKPLLIPGNEKQSNSNAFANNVVIAFNQKSNSNFSDRIFEGIGKTETAPESIPAPLQSIKKVESTPTMEEVYLPPTPIAVKMVSFQVGETPTSAPNPPPVVVPDAVILPAPTPVKESSLPTSSVTLPEEAPVSDSLNMGLMGKLESLLFPEKENLTPAPKRSPLQDFKNQLELAKSTTSKL